METKTFTNSSIYKAEDGDIQALLEYLQTGVLCAKSMLHPRLTENGGNFLFL